MNKLNICTINASRVPSTVWCKDFFMKVYMKLIFIVKCFRISLIMYYNERFNINLKITLKLKTVTSLFSCVTPTAFNKAAHDLKTWSEAANIEKQSSKVIISSDKWIKCHSIHSMQATALRRLCGRLEATRWRRICPLT